MHRTVQQSQIFEYIAQISRKLYKHPVCKYKYTYAQTCVRFYILGVNLSSNSNGYDCNSSRSLLLSMIIQRTYVETVPSVGRGNLPIIPDKSNRI